MMNNKNLLLILFFTSLCLPAWPRKVSGHVISKEDGTPIAAAYVTLFLNDSITGMSQSDASGKFTFEMDDGKPSTISATALGYEDMEVTFLPDTVTLSNSLTANSLLCSSTAIRLTLA